MREENLTRLKMDQEFLRELQRKKEQAIKEGDIVKLYDVLDTMLALDMEDEDIDLLYQKILEIAFDTLAQKLVKGEIFDLKKEKDLYTARAIYEHALERWDSKDFQGANELFLVLSFIVNDEEVRKAMLLALGATAKRVDLEEFLHRFVDRSQLDEKSFFFTSLTSEAERFLQQNASLIEDELKKIEKIAKSS